jgi:hypothetical protein
MEVWCWYSDLAQNKRSKRRPALHNKIPVHYLNAKKLHDFETVHFLTSLQHAHMQAMGPANVPHHRRSVPQNTKRTPSMQEPRNHHRCWNSVFRRNVQILQTRSLQDSLGKKHLQVYTCKVFVHRRTLPAVASESEQITRCLSPLPTCPWSPHHLLNSCNVRQDLTNHFHRKLFHP